MSMTNDDIRDAVQNVKTKCPKLDDFTANEIVYLAISAHKNKNIGVIDLMDAYVSAVNVLYRSAT